MQDNGPIALPPPPASPAPRPRIDIDHGMGTNPLCVDVVVDWSGVSGVALRNADSYVQISSFESSDATAPPRTTLRRPLYTAEVRAFTRAASGEHVAFKTKWTAADFGGAIDHFTVTLTLAVECQSTNAANVVGLYQGQTVTSVTLSADGLQATDARRSWIPRAVSRDTPVPANETTDAVNDG